MAEYIDLNLMNDVLAVGAAGFVIGVVIPLGARLIGYVIDSVRITLKGN